MRWIAPFLAVVFAMPSASADFIQRELGRNSEGQVVTGYVFEKGRRSQLKRRTGLAPRRSRSLSTFGRSHYYYPVPVFFGGHGACHSVFLWSGSQRGGLTVRVIR